jgi:hypothetical protein
MPDLRVAEQPAQRTAQLVGLVPIGVQPPTQTGLVQAPSGKKAIVPTAAQAAPAVREPIFA